MFEQIKEWAKRRYEISSGFDKAMIVSFTVLCVVDLVTLNIPMAIIDAVVVAYALWSVDA